MVDDRSSEQRIRTRYSLSPLGREGGFFTRVYSNEGAGASLSHILYMITQQSFSSLHRLSKDELWHVYGGGTAVQYRFYPDGTKERILLGPACVEGAECFTVVPAGTWQATMIEGAAEYVLFGCSVVPEYTDEDYTHGDIEVLKDLFPEDRELIERLCSETGV